MLHSSWSQSPAPFGTSASPCGTLGTLGLGGGAAGKGTGGLGIRARYRRFETDITGSCRAVGSAGSTTACAGATALQRLTMGLGLGPTVPTCCTGPCSQVSTLIWIWASLGTMQHLRALRAPKSVNNMPNLDCLSNVGKVYISSNVLEFLTVQAAGSARGAGIGQTLREARLSQLQQHQHQHQQHHHASHLCRVHISSKSN